MSENPYNSPNAYDARSNRQILRFRLGWWLLPLVGVAIGAGAWQIRLGIPGVHPAFGGPDPAKVIVFFAIAVLSCLVFATAIILRAIHTRSIRFGLCAIVPLSFVLATVVEFSMAAL